MLSAGAGPVFIHSAVAADSVQKQTVATASLRQGEDAIFKIEVLNGAGLAQSFGNGFGLFVFGFKGVHQVQSNQVGQLHFYRHGAAVGRAGIAHAGLVAGPRIGAVDVDNADG